MKAKFVTAIIVTILLASMVSMFFVPSAFAHTECDPFITDLIAGQHTDVGDVLVWNDIDYLYVKYVTTDDWYLTEIHLHIATSMEGIPQMNGNPIPGHFDYVEEGLWTQEYLFDIPLTWDPCTDIEIAAHAVVQRIVETCIDFESFQEKDFVSSASTPKGTVNFYMTNKEPLVPLVVGDTATLTPAGSYPMVAAPDTSPPYENIVAFTVVYPGNPYRDDYVKDDGGTGAGGKTLTDPQDTSQIPLLYHAYAQGLAIVIDVSGVEAVQGLDLAAIDLDWTEVWYFLYFDENDELMDKTPLGPPVGQSGDGVAYAVEYPNPVSKVAIWGGMNLGQEDRVGYAIDNICVASLEEETAWGDGCDFTGKNWATYFKYHVQPEEVRWPEEGTAYIGYEDWTGGDFDYNDFGMSMVVTEFHVSSGIVEIDIRCQGLVKLAGWHHKIHLKWTDGVTGQAHLEEWNSAETIQYRDEDHTFTGTMDVLLFDDTATDVGHITTLHVTFDEPVTLDRAPPYDPYIYVYNTGLTYHIDDTQSKTTPAGTADLPYILVVPVTWLPPAEGKAIWTVYGYFDDYYVTGTPTDWYNTWTGPNPTVPYVPYP